MSNTMELDIKSLIGEATAYDKNRCLRSDGLKAGLRVSQPLPLLKAAYWYSVSVLMTKY